MSKLILHLSRVTKNDLNKVGGKAANLGKLISNDFPVPEGYVLTTEAYSLFLSHNQLEKKISLLLAQIEYSDPTTIDNVSIQIQKIIRGAQIPDELIDEIKNEYERLPVKQIAIRSSATAEDLPTASFAGQLETFLNIQGKNRVIHYVKECYSSLWTSRAIAYRHNNEIPHETVLLAVIVQVMIPAISAGVLFTANPISLERNGILIESTFGLGESLVSSKITPDQFTVVRSGEHGKETFEILSHEISTKNLMIQGVEDGVELIELSKIKSHESSITDNQVIKLAQLGRAIEIYFGQPQDVEWAIDQSRKVHILQSRPITSLVSLPTRDETVWTRGYADDYWNDPTTPLFYGLLGNQLSLIVNDELNSIMGYPSMDGKLLRLSHGHVYFNLYVLKRKVEYEIPTFLRNEDVLNYFPEGRGKYGKKTMKKLPFQLSKRLIAEIRVILHDDDNGSILKTAKSYEKWDQEVFTPYCEKFDSRFTNLRKNGSITDLLELCDELDRVMVSHYRMVRYGIPVHNIGMNLTSRYLLSRFIGEELAIRTYPVLISGLKHSVSETNEGIHHLATLIRTQPNLRKIILEKPSEELFEYLEERKEEESVFRQFINEFNKFIENWGDRGFSREIYYPRWREAPSYIFDLLKSLVMDQDKEIDEIENRSLLLRQKTEKFVAYRIRSAKFGILKYKLFSVILNLARKYISFRENQRFNLDKWITRNRNLYLEIGRRFKEEGILKNPAEIFFLYKGEIRKLAQRKLTEKESHKISILVEKRHEEFLKFEHTTPPKFLQGSREFDDPLRETPNDTYFRGIAASQGMNTSKVRILTDIKEIAQVKAGEILVVPKTDPGWTPVFSKIGGLITETGGILSHGAVVSREYGIPAVTNIVNACQIFSTGQVVTINGNNGSVRTETR